MLCIQYVTDRILSVFFVQILKHCLIVFLLFLEQPKDSCILNEIMLKLFLLTSSVSSKCYCPHFTWSDRYLMQNTSQRFLLVLCTTRLLWLIIFEGDTWGEKNKINTYEGNRRRILYRRVTCSNNIVELMKLYNFCLSQLFEHRDQKIMNTS